MPTEPKNLGIVYLLYAQHFCAKNVLSSINQVPEDKSLHLLHDCLHSIDTCILTFICRVKL